MADESYLRHHKPIRDDSAEITALSSAAWRDSLIAAAEIRAVKFCRATTIASLGHCRSGVVLVRFRQLSQGISFLVRHRDRLMRIDVIGNRADVLESINTTGGL